VEELRDDLIPAARRCRPAALDLCIRQRLTAHDFDDAGGYAQLIAVPLVAADDRHPRAEIERQPLERPARAPPASMNAHRSTTRNGERAEVAGDRLGDAAAGHARIGVAGDVGEIHHRDRGHVGVGRVGRRCPRARGLHGVNPCDRRDEPVPAGRDRLDELRRARVVAERLTQLDMAWRARCR